jgi:hypothetical protein
MEVILRITTFCPGGFYLLTRQPVSMILGVSKSTTMVNFLKNIWAWLSRISLENKLTLIFSSAAIVISILSLYYTHRHDRLLLRPRLQIDCDFDRSTKKGGLYLTNTGLGPAVIQDFSIFGIERRNAGDLMIIVQQAKSKYDSDHYPKCYQHINENQIEG